MGATLVHGENTEYVIIRVWKDRIERKIEDEADKIWLDFLYTADKWFF